MQQPPSGETWVGNTCDISKSYDMQVLPGGWLHIYNKLKNKMNIVEFILKGIEILLGIRIYDSLRDTLFALVKQ
ncbi:hypothetical protein V1478_003999 [Vespula squamosa]|uniref:Uncharacterized protein n=1 Tax=Vespula squamosa TaxID=30214 RepID=A0ABD2BNF9_VESSQ